MNCKDCIHLQHNTCDHYNIEVDADAYRICADMVSKDGTYHNGTDHCPKCGKPVPQWGLCDECENVYLTHESVGNALDALDSWERVSK